ncbi:MAG: DUF3574 domain-containing protein [Gammaproteobacteria bacterium]
MIDRAARGGAFLATLAFLVAQGCVEGRTLTAAMPAPASSIDRGSCTGPGTLYRRTELFLGLSRPGAEPVTIGEIAGFLKDVVTPRFPAGFTLLEGHGQFRDRHGTIVREDARIVVLLYDPEDRTAGARIEAIRRAYARAFRQESVLRADGTACVFL